MESWEHEIRRRIAGLDLEPGRESAIVDELAQHLSDRYCELIAEGATDEQARSLTMSELDDAESLSKRRRPIETSNWQSKSIAHRDRNGVGFLSDLAFDIRYASRMLLKQPGFTFVITATLALGIGVNTVFVTLFGLALHPLLVNDPASLVSFEVKDSRDRDGFSFPEYRYFRDHTGALSELIAATWLQNVVLRDQSGSDARLITAQFVSENFFSALEARMLGVATVAALIPSRKAPRVDPLLALRCE